MEWIIKYKVQRILKDSSRTLRVCNSLDEAKEAAKEEVVHRDKIAIVKFRYASEENLKKDFNFDSSFVWMAYFHGWENLQTIKDRV